MKLKLTNYHKKVLKSLSIFLIYYFLPILVIIPFIFIYKNGEINDGLFQLVFDIVLAVILFLIYKEDLKEDFKDFKTNNEKYIKSAVKYWIMGLLIMALSNSIINLINPSGIAGNEESIRDLLTKDTFNMVFAIIIFAPFIEELMFRKTLKDIIKNKWILVLMSALLFGGAHVLSTYEAPIDLLYIIPYGVLGGFFAYMYYKTNNIFTSMTMHAIHNGLLVLLILLSQLGGQWKDFL